jgi:uncharacterized protein (TIGR02611 family)
MRRIVRSIVGSIVLLVGLVMLVLPGPALLVIPLGLAILAIDFPWAKAVMQKARIWMTRKNQSAPQPPSHPTAKMADKPRQQDLASSSQSTASGSGLSTP